VVVRSKRLPTITDLVKSLPLVVRVAGGGQVGWGECEASPLVSIAAFVSATAADWRREFEAIDAIERLHQRALSA